MHFYHVIPVGNFARGYDKYARAYRKSLIPESRYPNEFYLVREEDIHLAAEKARKLDLRLGGPRHGGLLLLETQVAEWDTRPHPRGGFGVVYPRPEVTLTCVRRITEDGRAGEVVSVEDAMAWSLSEHDLKPFDLLRPRSISFLPIARGCQARCGFCFSEASVSADQKGGPLDFDRARAWLQEAKRRRASRAVITGGGEPTLLREADLLRLVRLCRDHFDKVVLITNGHALVHGRTPAETHASVGALHGAGLTVLSVSRHHWLDVRCAAMMSLDTQGEELLHRVADVRRALPGLTVRLVCVLQRGGVETVGDVNAYLRWAAEHRRADEVCFKELYVSTSVESVYHDRRTNEFSRDHQVPISVVTRWAEALGLKPETHLPWGAPVYQTALGEPTRGRALRVAAYTEPSLYWERTSGIARSWNVMADGTCLASLEDRASVLLSPGVLAAPEVTS